VALVIALAGIALFTGQVGGRALAATYATTILADSPVSYWRLGEQSGVTAADSGAGANAGAYIGGYTLGVTGAIVSDTDTAVRFNGTTGYVSAPDAANLDITGDMTIEVWAKPGQLTGASQTLVQKGANSSSSSNWQYRISVTGANRWRASVYVGSASYDITDTLDTLSVARWDYLALVRSGPYLVLYVNGRNVGGVLISGATNVTTGALAFGRAGSLSNYYFNGSLDEVAIYNTGLSITQVQNHYAAGNGSTPTPTPTPVQSTDPVVMGAGDIACDPTDHSFNAGNGTTTNCQEKYTAALLVGANYALPIGDLAYDCATTAQINQSYVPSWGVYKSKSYPAVGNHEYKTTCGAPDGAGGYYSYWGAQGSPLDTNCAISCKGYYSYTIGSWHVIVLNSECAEVGGCQAGSAQEQWLQADLAANPAACTLAYFHRPFYTSGWSLGDAELHDIWQDLYVAHADLVLNGHDHDYERFKPQDAAGNYDPNGVTEIIVGMGGDSHGGFNGTAANSVVRDGTTYGVLQLTLHATSYDWQFLGDGQGGSFTDSGSASCH
jgi:hypothetical protein